MRIHYKYVFYFGVVVLLSLRTICFSAESVKNLLREATYAYSQQNYEQSVNLYNKAIELETNNFWAYLGRGGANLNIRQLQKAENDFNTALALATNTIFLSSAYMNRGYYYSQTTNYEKAVDDYSKAIQLNPSFQMAYSYRAHVFYLQQCYDFSLIDYNMAIMLKPDDVEAQYFKGDTYLAKLDYVKAIEAYGKALEIDTNYYWAYYRRAIAYSKIDDYPLSIKDLNRCIQLQPTNAEAFAGRGFAKSKMGDFKGAIEDSTKGVQLKTNSFETLNNLAWILATAPKAKMRDGQKAVEYAKRACELSSWKDAFCLGTLAASYAEVGNFDEAVKWERKCIIIGLPDKNMGQARKELRLFEQKKPYHADN